MMYIHITDVAYCENLLLCGIIAYMLLFELKALLIKNYLVSLRCCNTYLYRLACRGGG